MRRLDRLISELCPDGVGFASLGDVAEIVRGSGLTKNDLLESGIGCIHYGQIYTRYGTFADKTISFVSENLADKLKKVYPDNLIMAVTSENYEDVCKTVAWLGKESIVTGGHTAIIRHNQNPKYLAYYFQTSDFSQQKRKIAHGTKL
ncbi:MAG: restriction endonuclease subunit S [Defluviitaleaceae bacterium]|nr:restriction endonuclease subunit S [Defluviitaleaceae bacterium]